MLYFLMPLQFLQAGSIGVLQGAERFDHTRGYRFSTYIQYWIRKSILMLVERNCRGVRIPVRKSSLLLCIYSAESSHCNANTLHWLPAVCIEQSGEEDTES